MSSCGFGKLLGVLAVLWAACCGAPAEASTLYTYNFTQLFGPIGNPISVAGSFSGTADSFDHISLGTLTDFHIEASSPYFSASYSGLPDFFSYKIGDTVGTTLAILSLLPDASYNPLPDVCTGVATAIYCQTDGFGAIAILNSGSHPGVIAGSTIAPTVTLVSAIDTTPPVATTPIPGAVLLFSTALGGLGAVGAWRRKFSGTPSPRSATA